MANDTNCCKNCKYSMKRSEYSKSRYGNKSHAYECLIDGGYKRLDDTCNNYKECVNE